MSAFILHKADTLHSNGRRWVESVESLRERGFFVLDGGVKGLGQRRILVVINAGGVDVGHASFIDWESFQAPLFHLMPDQVTDHSTEAIKESITSQWNEPP